MCILYIMGFKRGIWLVKFRATIFVFCIFCAHTFAQDDSKILHLNGGRIESSVRLTNNLYYGIGGKAAILGSISAFEPSAETAYWNPARLAACKAYFFSIDFVPSFGVNIGRFVDINGEIQSSTDSAILDYKAPETEISYTNLSTIAHQSDQISSALFVFPIQKATFAVYYHRPFDVNLNAVFSDISAQINTKLSLSDEQEDIFFNSFIAGPLALKFGLDKVGFAGSYQISPKFSMGISLQRNSGHIFANGAANVEGAMLFGGKENTFNDPNDNWHNDLNQAIKTEYKGSALASQVDAAYDVRPNFQLNLVYNWSQKIVTNGYMDLTNNAVPALNLDVLGEDETDEEAEILDASKLKLSQLTLTKSVENETWNQLTLKMPSTLKLGMAYQINWFALHLNYSHGFSPIAFQYGDAEFGLSTDNLFRLGLDFKYVQLGMGIGTGNTITKGSKHFDEEQSSVYLPLFSLGSSFNISKMYSMNLMLVSTSTPILRTTFNVKF